MPAITGRSTMRSLLAMSVLAALGIAAAQAAEPAKPTAKKYVVPRTEAGQPDLRGVWNYGSDTPFERPSQFKDREFLTPDEAAAISKQIRDRSAQIEAGDGGTPIDPTGATTNSGWTTSGKAQTCALRSSSIRPTAACRRCKPASKSRTAASVLTPTACGRCASASAASARTGRKIAAYRSAA